MTHATDIVGYTFNADTYCRTCIDRMFIGEAVAYANRPRATDYRTPPFTERDFLTFEATLDTAAKARGINRYDERSYDSADFPKVIFGSQVESPEERCGSCGESLIP